MNIIKFDLTFSISSLLLALITLGIRYILNSTIQKNLSEHQKVNQEFYSLKQILIKTIDYNQSGIKDYED